MSCDHDYIQYQLQDPADKHIQYYDGGELQGPLSLILLFPVFVPYQHHQQVDRELLRSTMLFGSIPKAGVMSLISASGKKDNISGTASCEEPLSPPPMPPWNRYHAEQ
ncbi:hypothetical protein LTR17_000021 [Elasticomyces elasticus]|nr:hypothetical protein LTR17_000021 [Elasticomyces elasticus]